MKELLTELNKHLAQIRYHAVQLSLHLEHYEYAPDNISKIEIDSNVAALKPHCEMMLYIANEMREKGI